MGKNNIQNIFICVSQKKQSDRLGTTLVSVSPSVIPKFSWIRFSGNVFNPIEVTLVKSVVSCRYLGCMWCESCFQLSWLCRET